MEVTRQGVRSGPNFFRIFLFKRSLKVDIGVYCRFFENSAHFASYSPKIIFANFRKFLNNGQNAWKKCWGPFRGVRGSKINLTLSFSSSIVV